MFVSDHLMEVLFEKAEVYKQKEEDIPKTKNMQVLC